MKQLIGRIFDAEDLYPKEKKILISKIFYASHDIDRQVGSKFILRTGICQGDKIPVELWSLYDDKGNYVPKPADLNIDETLDILKVECIKNIERGKSQKVENLIGTIFDDEDLNLEEKKTLINKVFCASHDIDRQVGSNFILRTGICQGDNIPIELWSLYDDKGNRTPRPTDYNTKQIVDTMKEYCLEKPTKLR